MIVIFVSYFEASVIYKHFRSFVVSALCAPVRHLSASRSILKLKRRIVIVSFFNVKYMYLGTLLHEVYEPLVQMCALQVCVECFRPPREGTKFRLCTLYGRSYNFRPSMYVNAVRDLHISTRYRSKHPTIATQGHPKTCL